MTDNRPLPITFEEIIAKFEEIIAKAETLHKNGRRGEAIQIFTQIIKQCYAAANRHKSSANVQQDQTIADCLDMYAVPYDFYVAEAQYKLAMIYGSGPNNITLQEYKRAYMWVSLVIDSKRLIETEHLEAQNYRDQLKKRLSHQDLIEAQEMAQRCLNSGYDDCS